MEITFALPKNTINKTALAYAVSIIALILVGAVFAFNALAQNPFDISFPVAELGNCGSIEECKSYCDDPANSEACLDFAEKNGLMKAEEIEVARKVAGKTGPGGCQGIECQEYCEDPNHQDECFEFAAEEGLIPQEEIKKIRQIKEKTGTIRGPGGCRGESECREYCDDPNNLEECLDFAVKAEFMPQKEADRIRGIAGRGPGGCRGESECRKYCDDPDHLEECIAFAEEHGLIPKEDLAIAKKLINKDGPGGCRGAQCRDYCEDPDNVDACLEFAEEEGLIPQEELQMAKKFMKAAKENGGPGGCRGRQCKDYCEDPANQEACFEFAKENGILSEEELGHFEKGLEFQREIETSGGPGGCRSEEECMDFCSDPSRTDECLNFAVEKGFFSKEEAAESLEQFQKFKEYGNKFRQRPEDFIGVDFNPEEFEEQFQQFAEFGPPPGFEGGEGGFGPGGFGPEGFGEFGPGGFGGFGPPGFGGGGEFDHEDGAGGGFGGPGGCTSPVECLQYCSDPSNRKECTQVFRGGDSGAIRQGRVREFVQPGGQEGGFESEFGQPFEFEQGRFEGEHEGFPSGDSDDFQGSGQFPGQGEFQGNQGEFPGGPGQFQQFGPGGNFPSAEDFGEFGPPEGFSPPHGGFEGGNFGPIPGDFEGGGGFPPQGSFPEGGGFPQQGGEFQQPFPPSGYIPNQSFLGSILAPIVNILR